MKLLIALLLCTAFTLALTDRITLTPRGSPHQDNHHGDHRHHHQQLGCLWQKCKEDISKYCQNEISQPYNSSVLDSKCLHDHHKKLSSPCKDAIEKYHDLEHRIQRTCQSDFATYCPTMLNKEFNEHTINETCIKQNFHKFNSTCRHLLERWDVEHQSFNLRQFLSKNIYVFIPTLILTFVILFAFMFLCCAGCFALFTCCGTTNCGHFPCKTKPRSNGYSKIDLEMVQPDQEQMLVNDTEMTFMVPQQQQDQPQQFIAPAMYHPGMNGGATNQSFYVMYPQQAQGLSYPMYFPQQQQQQEDQPQK